MAFLEQGYSVTVICVGKINLGKMNWSTFAKPKISVAVEALWETQETT